MEARGDLRERDAECAALEELIGCAVAGQGGALRLEAGAGLGKTRLLEEAVHLARAAGCRVVTACGRELEATYPYAVVLQLFEQMVGEEDADRLFEGAAALARPLFQPSTADRSSEQSDFSSVHGLYWLTVHAAQTRPLLVCVDDLHWSDEASARFVSYLAERVSDLPIALVVASRAVSAGHDDGRAVPTTVPVLRLRPLRRDTIAGMVCDRVPSASTAFCDACAEVTEGNPFQLEELLREVSASRPGVDDPEHVRRLGRATVGRVALLRLVRLGPGPRAVADAVATLGDGARLRHVAQLTGLTPADVGRAADILAAEGILRAGEPFSFAHPLVRESIEDDAPGTYRALEHRRAAELLHAEGATPERVAAHLLAGPGMAEPWAVTLLQQVSARARERGATEAAVRYLRRALDEPPAAADLPLVLRDLGSAELAATEPEAADHLQRAYDGARDAQTRTEIARLWARALNDRGDTVTAAGVIEAAIEDAGGDPGLSVGLIADYLTTCVLHPDLRQAAMGRADPVLETLPESLGRDGGPLNAARAMRAAQASGPHASVAEVVEYADAAWQGGLLLDVDGPGGPAGRMLLWALLLAEQYARADAVATAMLKVAQQRGMLRAFRAASYYRGFCRLRRGRILEAQADVAQALAAGHEGPIGSAAHGAVAALLLIERGELDRAEAALARPAAEEEQWLPGGAYQLVAQGRIAVARGEPATGLAHFEEAGAWVHDTLGAERTVVPWRLAAARARLALGEPARAREMVAPLAEPAAGHPPVTTACARAVLSMTETGQRRTDGLREALAELDRTDAELEQARVRADLGGVLRREGSRADAVALLRQAVDRARGLGAELVAVRAEEELVAAGVRRPRRPASGLAALTPSERRVGRLAADGRTNAEIAQGLFVTPKTVEYHLRHVYQKLGVTGRRELPALFRPDPQGLV